MLFPFVRAWGAGRARDGKNREGSTAAGHHPLIAANQHDRWERLSRCGRAHAGGAVARNKADDGWTAGWRRSHLSHVH